VVKLLRKIIPLQQREDDSEWPLTQAERRELMGLQEQLTAALRKKKDDCSRAGM
jgi:hypothetical protein